MWAILLLCCICTAFASEGDTFASRTAEWFSITEEKAQGCIDRTQATRDDVVLMRKWLRDTPDETMCQKSLKRASCLFACCMQESGSMTGANVNLARFQEIIDEADMLKPEEKTTYKTYAEHCMSKVVSQDECVAAREFSHCMYQQSHKAKAEAQ